MKKAETVELFFLSSSQGGQHSLALEALVEQVAIEALELFVIFDRAAAQHAPGESRFEQRVRVELAEHVLHRFARHCRGDAGALDLHSDAQLAPASGRRLGSSDHFGDSRIVDGTLVLEARDRGVDLRWRVALAGQPLTDLYFGQFAAGGELQAVDVGVGHDCGNYKREGQPPKRVISGAPLPTVDRAIWSRLMSAVVEMPCTFSLNSSTFDAHRKASS